MRVRDIIGLEITSKKEMPGFEVVGTTGFEPATPASRTLCSTRLSHVPTDFSFKSAARNCQ